MGRKEKRVNVAMREEGNKGRKKFFFLKKKRQENPKKEIKERRNL